MSEPVGDILSTLANQLADHELLRLFPDRDPTTVRQLLRHAAGQFESSLPTAPPSKGIRQPALPLQAARPSGEEFQLFTDGASRGNPGLAGAGMQICNSSGEEIAATGTFLGECTNNVAEYQALLLGLETIQELGIMRVAIFLDSELIVRQLQGRYKVKDAKLKPLFVKAQKLLTGLTSFRVAHIPRSQNARADQLANEGIDERVKGER